MNIGTLKNLYDSYLLSNSGKEFSVCLEEIMPSIMVRKEKGEKMSVLKIMDLLTKASYTK